MTYKRREEFSMEVSMAGSELVEIRERLARVEGRVEELSKRIDDLNHSLSKRIDDLSRSLTKRIDSLEVRVSRIEYLGWGTLFFILVTLVTVLLKI
jgi:predicted  nucleic acid-binding Zn-ribbon protein